MNTKEVMADFQFLGNRVSKLVIETKQLEEKGRAELSYDFDYKVTHISEMDNNILGILQFSVQTKAKIKKKILFKIDLTMEGAFAGNLEKIPKEKFAEMLEMNGLANLMNISRAYLVSMSAQSGINPPVRLPMINLIKLKEKKQKSEVKPKTEE
ncbi:MAG: preprotein translocase subunit SecB [Tissierellia bacterium]|nr:preprotein translocase subunit SecB [Tissierellia bacterium]